MVTCCYGNRPWNRLGSRAVEILLRERQREVRREREREREREGKRQGRRERKLNGEKVSRKWRGWRAGIIQASKQLASHQNFKAQFTVTCIPSDHGWLVHSRVSLGFEWIENTIPQKGGSSFIYIHLTGMLPLYSTHYITTGMADGCHYSQTVSLSLSLSLLLSLCLCSTSLIFWGWGHLNSPHCLHKIFACRGEL